MTISGRCRSTARCSSSTERQALGTPAGVRSDRRPRSALALALALFFLVACEDSAPSRPSPRFERVLERPPASRLLVVIVDDAAAARAEEPRLWTALDRLHDRARRLESAPGLGADAVLDALLALARAVADAEEPGAVAGGRAASGDLPVALAPERDLGLPSAVPGHWWPELSEEDRRAFARTCVSVEDALWRLLILRLRGLAGARPWRTPGTPRLAPGGRRAQAMSLALEDLMRRAGSNATLLLVATNEGRADRGAEIYLAGPGIRLDALATQAAAPPRRLDADALVGLAAALVGRRGADALAAPPEIDWSPEEAARWAASPR